MTTVHPKTTQATILVVDDTSMCREAVADILETRGYSVLSAQNGRECLDLLLSESPDLVLLDVVMPGMDGIDVLKVIRNTPRWHELPVMLLTDRADRALVQRAALLEVQGYILKASFTPDELLSRVAKCLTPSVDAVVPEKVATSESSRRSQALDRAVDGRRGRPSTTTRAYQQETRRRTRSKDNVLNRIRRVLEVRPIPPIMHYIISQTNSSATTIHDVANTVRQDQALALRVMKVANSSYYCSGRRVQTLNEAAGRLGMAGIRNAIVAVVGIDHFADMGESGLIPQRFWEHSLAVAALCQNLAESIGRPDAEDIFLAGLLHDLGRLALAQAYPKDYHQVIDDSRETDRSLATVESEMFEVDHADVTREVLEYLKLPKDVVTIASSHHHPVQTILSSRRDPQPSLIMGLSDQLAHVLLMGDSGESSLSPIGDYIQGLHIDALSVAAIGLQTVDRISETEIFYASQGNEVFLPPLATELAKSVSPAPRVEIIAKAAPYDALSLFFDRLGWRVSEQPTVIIVFATSQSDLDSHLRRLRERFSSNEGPVSLLVVAEKPDLNVPQLDTNWNVATVALPTKYNTVLNTTARLLTVG